MLEIQERFDTVGYESVAKRAGAAELHITEAFNGGSVAGFIAYSYGADKTVIYDYDDGGDLMLCDGLVRSVMLKSVLKGIEHMLFELDDGYKFEVLKKLRFLSGESRLCSGLDSFMNSCKSCGKKKD